MSLTTRSAESKPIKTPKPKQATIRWERKHPRRGDGENAKVSAEFSGSANSAREEAVKNVKSATQKHASKASSNRSVTVNTDYEVKTQEKIEESTTREISNINVSRTLNFTFRQLNQEHIVLVHLTNARVAYYARDLLVDSNGNALSDEQGEPIVRHTYREVSLPELQSLLDETIIESWHDKVRAAVVRVLTGIPDYKDVLQAVVEAANPRDNNGDSVRGAEYLRFPRNLTTTWRIPIANCHSRAWHSAVLGQDHYANGWSHRRLRTRTRRCARPILARPTRSGSGGADHRQLSKAQVLREQLAQKIVADQDEKAAKIFAQLYPPPPPAAPKPVSNG